MRSLHRSLLQPQRFERVIAQRTMVQQVLMNPIIDALKFVGKAARPQMRFYAGTKPIAGARDRSRAATATVSDLP